MRALLPLLLVAAGCRPDVRAAVERPPNVVVIVIDTLRADRLGAYGYGRPTSPVLDRLAREGALCEDVTAQASWTLPSMVSMFQGRYLTEYRDVFLEDAPTLAEIFRAAGYRTVGIVGNGLLSGRSGFDRGFEHYDSRKPAREGLRSSPSRTAEELFSAARGPLEQALGEEDGEAPPPLFAYLHFMDPHGPYVQQAAYEDELPTDPAASGVDLDRQRLEYARARPHRAGRRVTLATWDRMRAELARYDQEVRYADEYVGMVLGLLEERGLLDDTLVAVVADHGEGLYDHRTPPGPELRDDPLPNKYFHLAHGKQLYRELVHTPMILWGPGVPGGVRVTDPVENVDLLPTLLELVGLGAVEGLHGRSLVPALRGERLPERLVFSSVLEEQSVRDPSGVWKLIVPGERGEGRAVRLFDLSRDPRELENLASIEPERVAELSAALEAWRAAHPTQTSLGRRKSRETLEDLQELGYAGED